MRTRTNLVIAATLGFALAIAAAPTIASATGVGTVNVQLVSPSGTPLELESVTVALQGSSYHATMDTVTSGIATFTGVPAGVHLVASTVTDTVYLGGHTATFTVASGHTATEWIIEARGATIDGSLVNSSSAPIVGANIDLLNSAGRSIAETTTDVSGNYSFGPLKSESVRVQFNGRISAYSTGTSTDPASEYAWSYWPDTLKFTHAAALSVHQQTAHASASQLHSISTVLQTPNTLGVSLSFEVPLTPSDLVLFSAKYPCDTFSARIDATGLATAVPAVAKTYKVAIPQFSAITGTTQYLWWTGNSTPPSYDSTKAKAYVYTGETDVALIFIQAEY